MTTEAINTVYAIDYQQAFNYVLGLIVMGLGWFFKGVQTDLKAIEKNLHNKTDDEDHKLLQNNFFLLREQIPKEYASKDDIKQIQSTCNEIFALLRDKVDKK